LYDALKLRDNGKLIGIRLSSLSPVSQIQFSLMAPRIESELLDSGITLWRNLEGALADDPIMNFGAMWLCQHLRSPVGVPVIFGDVILTGRDSGGFPVPLTIKEVRQFQNLMTSVKTRAAD
jgi:hypothetical protein